MTTRSYDLKRKYEMMFILEVMESANAKSQVNEILNQHGANILKEEDMGVKTLAYQIKKRDKGFYYLIQMELEPKVLKDINNDIRLNEHILKYMALIITEKKEKPKPEKKKKITRQDRPQESNNSPTAKESGEKSESKETKSASTEA